MRSPTARSASGSSPRGTGAIGNRTIATISLAIFLFDPTSAAALFADRVEVWAAENVTHDTNILRLSRHIDPTSVGARQLGDSYNTTKIGVAADLPVSLQRFQAAYTWQSTRYRAFSNLDFNGHLATLNWAWVIDHRFYGTVGAADAKSLASFSNIQRNAQDLVTTRQAYASGNWKMTPIWRASGRLEWGKSEHSDALRSLNDIETVMAELALAYVTQQDNTVAAVARAERGKRPPTAGFGGFSDINNTYRQTGAGVTAAWVFTPQSRLDGNLFFVHRGYEQDTRRNFSGATGRALYTWTPTPKTTVVAAIFRDIGPAEDVTTAFVLATGVYVRPKWDLTEKASLQANLEYDRWQYRGDPILGGTFTHRLRTYGASLAYRPTRKTILNAGVNRETRTSDLLLGDYDAEVLFIEGRIGF
jgi:exopolysaccharide biosynthesis operon protein EpsL